MGGTPQTLTLTLTLTLTVILTLTLFLAGTRQVRDVAMSKRGQAHKVEEKFMTRCNQDGMSPVQSEGRFNLRTMSARTKERLQMGVEERHGWTLRTSREEVKHLKEQLLDEQYSHLLDKEAVGMRARTQTMKDKDALTQAGIKGDKLQLLVVAAEQSTKEVERRLRNESSQGDKALRRVKALERAQENIVAQLNARSLELEATHAQKKESEKELRRVHRDNREAENELSRFRSELKVKCEELEVRNSQLQTCKDLHVKHKKRANTTVDKLMQERENLSQVRTLPLSLS